VKLELLARVVPFSVISCLPEMSRARMVLNVIAHPRTKRGERTPELVVREFGDWEAHMCKGHVRHANMEWQPLMLVVGEQSHGLVLREGVAYRIIELNTNAKRCVLEIPAKDALNRPSEVAEKILREFILRERFARQTYAHTARNASRVS